ncbi:MAG: putative phage abortive infection protein [Aquaticitalea sp.]
MNEENKKPNKDEYKILRPLIIWSIVIVVGFWVVNMIALGFMPSTERGTLGDMFGAVNAIFSGLAFAGIIVSLYMQRIDLKNQQIQLEQNHDEIQQTNREFKIQNDTLQIQKFEIQYYKMIDLHKENVNEMNITFFELSKVPFNSRTGDGFNAHEVQRDVQGRKIFDGMIKELHLIYFTIGMAAENMGIKLDSIKLFDFAYQIFFYGKKNSHKFDFGDTIPSFKRQVIEEIEVLQKHFYNRHLEEIKVETKSDENFTLKFYPYEGHEPRLGHYYRHLFQTVKYVVQQEEKGLIGIDETRQYLRVLRAQLSNAEQLLLYYNYMCGFGSNWDYLGDKGYQFLTKYRMIHNIPISSVIGVENPRIHFDDFIKNHATTVDPLFEWGDFEKKN